MRQSVSKGGATTGLEVVVCALARSIQLSSQNIGFDLTIPLISAKLVEPPRKEGQLICCKTRDNQFKLFNAHDVILKVEPAAVNLVTYRLT